MIKRVLRWTQYALFFIGTVALACCVFFLAQEKLFQAYESWSFQRALQQGHSTATRLSPSQFSVPSDVRPTPPITAPAGRAVIGRLEIPSVKLSVMVLADDNARSLRLGAGHIPGTALPGTPGNVGVAGHRDTVFRALRGISRNDRITLTTPAGTYLYQVQFTRVVNPDDVQVLASSAQPSLTLVTCYPFYYVGAAPKRFVVHARFAPAPANRPVVSSVAHGDATRESDPAAAAGPRLARTARRLRRLPGETGASNNG